MRFAFYLRLAWAGIGRSKTAWLPFLFTSIGMAATFFVLLSLATSPALVGIGGGRTLTSILGLGSYVMGLFALIFLYYTNSFLLRRRKKEFGLYNILGMGKWNVGRILFWEVLLSLLLTLLAGILCGAALSKLAEFLLIRLVHASARFSLSISSEAVMATVLLFTAIFAVMLFSGLLQVRLSNPIALMRSEAAGEKPPKGNFVLGLAGFFLLAGAYGLAVTIQDPIQALSLFFVAVIMVIIATYLLFVAGSVLLCRILQKNKRYYYRADRFISLSSMTFRMKRNGAGLASICILATMVLVTITASACLYFGVEDSLRAQYPRELSVRVSFADARDLADPSADSLLRQAVDQPLSRAGCTAKNESRSRTVSCGVPATEASLAPARKDASQDFYFLELMPLSDYNARSGGSDTLSPGQVLLWSDGRPYPFETILLGEQTFTVVPASAPLSDAALSFSETMPTLYLSMPDFSQCVAAAQAEYSRFLAGADSPDAPVRGAWRMAFDTDLSPEGQIALAQELSAAFSPLSSRMSWDLSVSTAARAGNRAEFYGLYGGIFFLGILLSIVFLAATVLIMYYKQTSEGMEDQSRFSIMQKVGMTRQEIRKSINAQMRTVFLLPIGAAVVHLAFAFPMLRRMLLLFDLKNLPLLLTTAGVSVVVFALAYVLVYRLTSNAYFKIVSQA